jgi:hypothetical protein
MNIWEISAEKQRLKKKSPNGNSRAETYNWNGILFDEISSRLERTEESSK